jgi:agmatine deiminase
MEGGSVDFNSEGTVMTSTCCLLNKNAITAKSKTDRAYLLDYYGMEQVLWVDEHCGRRQTGIDDTVRFVNGTPLSPLLKKIK